jgi:pyruvate/2-oxoacid:ferredoxin oxidoreductase beta subunit
LGIPHHETTVLAGIGCSGTVQNNISACGYHALHGRVLPAALQHACARRGFAFLEVLSPCVTCNDAYVDWTARVAEADDAAWESAPSRRAHPPPAAQDAAAEALTEDYRRIMARHAV